MTRNLPTGRELTNEIPSYITHWSSPLTGEPAGAFMGLMNSEPHSSEARNQFPISLPAGHYMLTCITAENGGASQALTATLRINGVDSALTVTIGIGAHSAIGEADLPATDPALLSVLLNTNLPNTGQPTDMATFSLAKA